MLSVVIGLMLILMFLAVPIGFTLAITGCIGLWMVDGFGTVMAIAGTVPYRTTADFVLTVLPMFILLAEFISRSRLAKDLFDLANRWIGHFRGGVGIATIMASAGFAAMAGTSSAAAAVFSRIAIPEMQRLGYQDDIAAGVVTVAGTLAIMIPPSLTLVVYGMLTETSVGKLLVAGVIPGIISAINLAIGVWVYAKVVPEAVPTAPRCKWADRFRGMGSLLPLIVLVLIIIGGLYTGVATPTEVGALGALSALVMCVLMRRLAYGEVAAALRHTVMIATMIFTIIIGAMIFGYFLTLTQAPQHLMTQIKQSGLPPWAVIGVLVVIYLILGCFIDQMAILLLTMPITFPLVVSLGYDPIWFGIVFTKLTEIGLVTPPMGLNGYIVSGTSGIPLARVFRGACILLMWDGFTLLLLLFIPSLSTFLPSLMK